MLRPYATLFALTLAACGGSVNSDPAGAGGGASASSATGSSCVEPEPNCVFQCDSGNVSGGAATCEQGVWQCPPGTFDESICPPDCPDIVAACESCSDGVFTCAPNDTCTNPCPAVACSECAPGQGPALFGACACACDALGRYSCAVVDGCCESDLDCGDLVYSPCVNNVCKQVEAGGCWSDAECPRGQTCQGAFVCPCGADCDGADQAGTCQ